MLNQQQNKNKTLEMLSCCVVLFFTQKIYSEYNEIIENRKQIKHYIQAQQIMYTL